MVACARTLDPVCVKLAILAPRTLAEGGWQMALMKCPTCGQRVDVEYKTAQVDGGYRLSRYILGFDKAKCTSDAAYELEGVYICDDLNEEAWVVHRITRR